MSSQAAELSFLRCWNCQSLIPAASDQCRMCGAPVGEENAAQAAKERRSQIKVEEPVIADLSSAAANETPRTTKQADNAAPEPTLTVKTHSTSQKPAASTVRKKSESAEQVRSTYPEPLSTRAESTSTETTREPIVRDTATEQPAIPAQQQKVQHEERSTESSLQPPSFHKYNSSGKLLGWLVNFTDPTGTAVEIREDAFFLSARKLRNNDLVISGEGISTPHALISSRVSNSGKLQSLVVQDLLSTGGVQIRKRDTASFQVVDEEEQLSHGDSIRLGAEEFLIALL